MRSSSVSCSAPIARARGVALGLMALVLASACGDSPAEPSGGRDVPNAAAVQAKLAAVVAITDQPVLSVFDFTGLAGGSVDLSVGRTLADALMPPGRRGGGAPALRRAVGERGLAARGAADGTLPAAVVAELAVREEVYGRTYTGYPAWRLDTLANGEPVPGAPVNGVRFKLPAVDAIGRVTDAYVADMDIVNASANGFTGYTTTVRTRAGAVVLELTSLADAGGWGAGERFEGYLARGADRYSFEESIDFGPDGGVMTATGTAPFAGLRYESEIAYETTQSSLRLNVDLRLTLDDDVFRIVAHGDPSAADFVAGTLHMNGQLLGTLTSGGLTLPNGQPDVRMTQLFGAIRAATVTLPSALGIAVVPMFALVAIQ